MPYWVELTTKHTWVERTMEASVETDYLPPFESEKPYNSCMRDAKMFRQTLTEL